jgi:hypothetical protein
MYQKEIAPKWLFIWMGLDWGWAPPKDLILLIESHLHNLYFYVKFSLQFARDCVSQGFIWCVRLSFLFGGEERGFSIPFFGNMGWRRKREREKLYVGFIVRW